MTTHRTRIALADGRDLFYYDSSGGTGRDAYPDRRDLPARSPAAQLRYDALRDEWIAVAAARQSRPQLPTTSDCPLCPSKGDRLTEVPAPDYEVAVFENRFPSFGGPSDQAAVPDPLSPRRPATGRCEVVCFTSDHTAAFADLPASRARIVIDALADRTTELSKLDGLEQVFCFENRGEEIGVTLHHPHGQIYGYPYVASTARTMLDQATRHADHTGRNLFADLLAAERAAGERIVAGNDDWTAFVPVAARWPFEIHVYPHIRVPDLPALPDRYRDSFARLYPRLLRGLDAVFDQPMPYISGWHQAPVRQHRDVAYLHLELFSIRRAPGKLKHPAGSESAMGGFVSDIPPEKAAAMLRDAMPDDTPRETIR